MSAAAILERETTQPQRGFLLSPKERARIWEKVVIPDDPAGCWRWIGAKNSAGDGVVRFRSKLRSAAQVIWEDTGHEAVPPRKRLVRTCANVWCVNPAHRTRQGPAGRDVYTADGVLPAASGAPVIPAAVATLPVPPELAAPAADDAPSLEVEDAPDAGGDEAPELERAPRVITVPIDAALTALFDKPGMHVLVIDNTGSQKCFYYTPDPECEGSGKDWRGALESARKKYAAKAARPKVGAA